MPDKKILLILKDDGDVQGKLLRNASRLDPALKWLLILAGLALTFVCVVMLRPRIPVAVALTPTPQPTPLPLRVAGPPDRSTVALAQPVQLRVAGAVAGPVTRLALRVNGIEADAVIPTPIGPAEMTAAGARPMQAVTTLTHLFTWRPENAGETAVEVVIYTLDGQSHSTPPLTYYVTDNRAMLTAVVRQIGPLRTPTSAPPPWLSSPTPTVTPLPNWATPATTPPVPPPPTATAGWWSPVPPAVTATVVPTASPDVGAPDVSLDF
jgi:hypothetical protein